MILRDGFTITNDPRLDRIKKFDEKSRQYPIREIVKAKTMKTMIWECSKVLDQGDQGSCIGHGIAHELIATPVPVKRITHKFAVKKIYYEAQRLDEWEGGEYPGAYPQYSGTSVLAGIKATQAMGYFDEFRWSFGIEDLILGVGNSGPAVLGVNWYESFMTPDKEGFIYANGSVVGGHCILCRGVDIVNKYFILRNSWGKKWGKKGDCYINFDQMDFLLGQDGEAAFFINRKDPKGGKK